MIDFDDVTNENEIDHNQNGQVFQIIRTKNKSYGFLGQEKQMRY